MSTLSWNIFFDNASWTTNLSMVRHIMKIKRYKILHISPHLGGGVGRVLTNYLKATKKSEKFEHKIYCLDSINPNAKKFLSDENISHKELVPQNELLEEINGYDIVIIHWWNHPLLFDFLVRFELPPCRIAFWAHVSGNAAPNFFSHTLFEYPDYFVFTTPMSYLVKEVTDHKGGSQKLRDIWSTGGFEHVKNRDGAKESNCFTIGYVGALDFAKLYPNFISLCSKITLPNVRFVVCGDGGDIDQLKQQAQELHLENRIIFTGYVDNVAEYLETFDIFAYSLNQYHYGTCDQALAEAMASGVVPVVFDNAMENYMVHHLYTGIVAKNENEYIAGIIKLYNSKALRKRLSINAEEESLRRFSLVKTVNEWDALFDQILKLPKSAKRWSGVCSGRNAKPYEVFLESIGDYARVFRVGDEMDIRKLLDRSIAWKAKTKGTPHHYHTFFKNDALLSRWAALLQA